MISPRALSTPAFRAWDAPLWSVFMRTTSSRPAESSVAIFQVWSVEPSSTITISRSRNDCLSSSESAAGSSFAELYTGRTIETLGALPSGPAESRCCWITIALRPSLVRHGDIGVDNRPEDAVELLCYEPPRIVGYH